MRATARVMCDRMRVAVDGEWKDEIGFGRCGIFVFGVKPISIVAQDINVLPIFPSRKRADGAFR